MDILMDGYYQSPSRDEIKREKRKEKLKYLNARMLLNNLIDKVKKLKNQQNGY